MALRRRVGRGRAVRWAALLVLGALPLLHRRSWAAWEADTKHPEFERRRMALLALREVPKWRVNRAMNVLAAARHGADLETTRVLHESLRSLAPRAPGPSVRALAWLESHAAQAVMGAIDIEEEGLEDEIVRHLLNAPAAAARQRGLLLLERIGPRAATAAVAVRRLASDPDSEVRRLCLRTLAHIDPDGPYLFRASLAVAGDPDDAVRRRAWRVLVRAPQTLERARDPRFAPLLAEGFGREFPELPAPLREALEQGLAAGR